MLAIGLACSELLLVSDFVASWWRIVSVPSRMGSGGGSRMRQSKRLWSVLAIGLTCSELLPLSDVIGGGSTRFMLTGWTWLASLFLSIVRYIGCLI